MAINVFKDTNSHTLQKVINLSGVSIQRGQCVSITANIVNGAYEIALFDGINGAFGGVVMDTEIINNAFGYIAYNGSTVDFLDTSALAVGTELYCDINGNLTDVPNGDPLAIVINSEVSNGVVRLYLNGEEIFGARAMNQTITNLPIPTANTEINHVLQPKLKQLTFRARNNANLQFSFKVGESGTNFMTLNSGAVYSASNLNLASSTLYIQSDIGGTILEIEEWS